MKRVLNILLAMIMVFTTIPLSALAEDLTIDNPQPLIDSAEQQNSSYGYFSFEIPDIVVTSPSALTVQVEKHSDNSLYWSSDNGEESIFEYHELTTDTDIIAFESGYFAQERVQPRGIVALSELEYIDIGTAEELSNIRNNLSGTYRLTADITLTGNWTPIGTATAPFSGTLVGEHHKIYNLKVSGNVTYAGLFGYTHEANIRDVGLENADVQPIVNPYGADAYCYAGGFVGYSVNSSFTNLYSTGIIKAHSNARGVTKPDNFSEAYAGGIVGYSNNDALTYCNNFAYVSDIAEGSFGFVWGSAWIHFQSKTGGIAGNAIKTVISYSTNRQALKSGGFAGYVGGIAGGLQEGIIKNSFNAGNVENSLSWSGSGSGNTAFFYGGIVGASNDSSLIDVYNTGNVSLTVIASGSLQNYDLLSGDGGIIASSSKSTVANAYNIGSINEVSINGQWKTQGNGRGGIVGLGSTENPNTFYNVHYLNGTAYVGTNNESGNGIFVRTDLSMKTDAFAVELGNAYWNNIGWDGDNFSIIYNNGYPILKDIYYDELDTKDDSVMDDDNTRHHIYVSTIETNSDGEHLPIANAEILIGDVVVAQTDSHGHATIDTVYSGKQLVTVRKSGYKTVQQFYMIKAGGRFVFLDRQSVPPKPYLTMFEDAYTEYDILCNNLYVPEKDEQNTNLLVKIDWAGQSPKNIELFQEAGAALTLQEFSSDNDNIQLGKVFQKDKPIYIRFGDIVEKTNIKIISELQNIENTEGVNLLPNQMHFLDGSALTILPNTFGISSVVLPISAETFIEDDVNGIIVTRIAINIAERGWEQSTSNRHRKAQYIPGHTADTGWLILKQNIDDLKNGFANAVANNAEDQLREANKAYKDFKSMLNLKQKPKTNITKGIGFDVEFIGYYEVKQDRYGNIIEQSGGIIGQISGNATYTQQLAIGPVPVYFEIGGGLDVSAGLNYKWEKENPNGLAGKIELTPNLHIEGGVGVVGVVTIGAGGEVKVPMEFEYSFVMEDWTNKGKLNASAYVRLNALWGLADWRYDLRSYTKILWDTSTIQETQMSPLYLQRSIGNQPELILADRSYNESTTPWNGNSNILQSSVNPAFVPQLAFVDGKYVLLYNADAATATDGNNIKLVYSVLDNGVWSEPQQVWHSDTADFNATFAIMDNELYVVWHKSKTVIDSTDIQTIIDAVSIGSEIASAKFDAMTNSFTSQQFVTNNNTVDYNPVLTTDGSTLAALWITNDSNDVLIHSGSYTILKSILVGNTWSYPEIVYTSGNVIAEIASGYYGNSLKIAIGEFNADGTRLVKMIDGTVLSDGQLASGLRFNKDGFDWTVDGTVYSYGFTDAQTNVVTAGGNKVISANNKFVANGSKQTLIWSSSDTNAINKTEYKIYASLENGDGYGNPIEVYSTENIIQSFDVNLDDSGKYRLVLNEKDSYDVHHICYADVDLPINVSLDYVRLDEIEHNGNIQPVIYYVTNKSDKPVTSFNLAIKSGNVNFRNAVVPCNIASGETASFQDNLDVSAITDEALLEVTVTVNGEVDLSDNTRSVRIGLTDVAVNVQQLVLNDSHLFIIEAINESRINAKSVNLVVTDENNNTLKIIALGKIDSGNISYQQFEIANDDIDFNSKAAKYMFFELTLNQQTDYCESNNKTLAIIYADEADQTFFNITAMAGTGGTVLGGGSYASGATVTLTATANSGYIFDGWYENNTKVAGVGATYTFTASANRTLEARFTSTVAASYTITAKAGTGGTVSGGGSYVSGTAVTLTATPNSNYTFDGWYEGSAKVNGVGATYLFTVTANRTLEARFIYVGSNDDGSNNDDSSDSSSDSSSSIPNQPAKSTDEIIIDQLNQGINPIINMSNNSATILGSTLLKMLYANKTLAINRRISSLILSPENITEMSLKADDKIVIDFAQSAVTFKADVSQIDKLNDQLLKYFYNISLSINGKKIEAFNTPLSICFNVAGLKLTNDQKNKLTGIRYLDENEYNQLGGMFISKDVVELKTSKLSKYGILISNTLVSIVTSIDKNTYTVNGNTKTTDVAPMIIDDRTMVPIRFIAEAFGAEVEWIGETLGVVINLDGKTMNMNIGVKSQGMDVAPTIVNDRTMVPLRYISEQLDANVIWNGDIKSIDIYR